jgi:hypothetical protein
MILTPLAEGFQFFRALIFQCAIFQFNNNVRVKKEKASLTKEQTNVKEKDDHPGYPIVHRSDYFHARAKYSFHRRPASNLPYIVMHAPQKMTRGALPSSCNSRNVSLFHETRSCES